MSRVCETIDCDTDLIGKRAGTRFCSVACYHRTWRASRRRALRRVPATCPACDMEFLPSIGNGAKVSTQVYCSRQCVNRRRGTATAHLYSGRRRESCGMCGGPRGDSSHSTYCRDCQYVRQLWSAYRITRAEFDDLFARQAGRCAIGGELLDLDRRGPQGYRLIHVDHDHVTGIVRGVTCNRHNRALGMFDDDPVLLRRAADYLEAT